MTASLAGCLGGNNGKPANSDSPGDSTQTIDNMPDEVSDVRSLAERYYEEVQSHLNDARVFINGEGEIALEYKSNKQTEDALETEMYQLADLFVETIENEEEATTLSIVVGKVQAIAPKPTVLAYYNDNLEQDAFFETIEVLPIERA